MPMTAFGQGMPRKGQNLLPAIARQPQARTLPRLAGDLPYRIWPRVESLQAGSWTTLHDHPWAQLSYAMSGVLQVRTAHGLFMAPPQRAIWIPAHLPHEVITQEAAEMRSLYIRIDAITTTPLATLSQCCVLDVPALTRELILAFCERYTDHDVDAATHRLAQVLLDELSGVPSAMIDLPLPTDARLRRLCDALMAHPSDRRTLAQWGHDVGLTERSLVRLFQKQTGLSVGDWRRRLRLLKSLDALQQGEKVSNVAQACGYQSSSAFITAFQQMFGNTPRQLFP
jgi:AraC-like DNA-binding protein